MFASATPEVLEAICGWVSSGKDKRSNQVLDDYIEAYTPLVKYSKRRTTIKTQWIFYDIQPLYDTVNKEEFEGTVETPITLGKKPPNRRRHSIRLGSYTPEEDIIRIHPYLDQDFVPEFFVRYMVFHEMLHSFLGFQTTHTGRRIVHTPELYALEQKYPDYRRSIAWHDDSRNLERLLGKVA